VLQNKYDMDGEAIGIKVGNTPVSGATPSAGGQTLSRSSEKKKKEGGCCK